MEGFEIRDRDDAQKTHPLVRDAAVQLIGKEFRVAYVHAETNGHSIVMLVTHCGAFVKCTKCDVMFTMLNLKQSKVGNDIVGLMVMHGWKLIGHNDPNRFEVQ